MRAPVLALLLLSTPAMAERAQPGSVPTPLTETERTAFAVSVRPCWNVAALPAEAQAVSVTLAFRIGTDRRPPAGTIRLAGHSGADGAGIAPAFEAARRAVVRCGAGGFDLPGHKHAEWTSVELTFAGGLSR